MEHNWMMIEMISFEWAHCKKEKEEKEKEKEKKEKWKRIINKVQGQLVPKSKK